MSKLLIGKERRVLAGCLAAMLCCSAGAQDRPQGQPTGAAGAARTSPKMTVQHAGQTPSGKGEAETFTGAVRRDGQFRAIAPGRIVGGTNTFEPGARTFWHSHSLGQTLIVVSGVGLTQAEGDAPVLIRPGDIITIAPGVRHWHGAAPTTAMAHIAITEIDPAGNAVRWGEAVSETAYLAADRAARSGH